MQMEDKKNLSSGFSFADEKIKLIDILTEDDDFLVEDSFSDSNIEFRVSGFRNSRELEMLQQNRPSFQRKSLAWDSQFFDSPGVLDLEELSCINRGVKTAEACLQDAQKRISELKSRPNDDDDDGVCAAWFEIEPSLYKLKSTKTFDDVASKARKKVDQSLRNEVKSSQTSTGKSSIKVESTLKRRKGRNISTISNNSRNSGEKSLFTGQVLFPKKKSALQSWSNANYNSGSSAQTSSHLKRKTQSRESRLRASLSSSMIPNKNISQTELVSSSVDKIKQPSPGFKTDLNVTKSSRGALVGTDENEASRLQSPFNTPRICSSSANNFKPSGLRPPSPQIGFFDENTCPRYHDTARNGKLSPIILREAGSSCEFACRKSENVLSQDSNKESRHSWARKKLKGTCSEVAKKIKRSKTDHTKKNLPSSDVDQLGTLSRCLAAIDLKEEKLTQPEKRAPLADKTSSYNFICEFN